MIDCGSFCEYPELADPEGGPDTIIDEYDKKITSLSSNQRGLGKGGCLEHKQT